MTGSLSFGAEWGRGVFINGADEKRLATTPTRTALLACIGKFHAARGIVAITALRVVRKCNPYVQYSSTAVQWVSVVVPRSPPDYYGFMKGYFEYWH